MYRKYVKRVIDIVMVSITLLFLFPFLLCIVSCLYYANKGAGVFFIQERPGENGIPFRVMKFKTMTDQTDSEGNLLSDRDRLTQIGIFLRKTSIDELPQLLNVLRGEMSFIGPRPLLMEYLPLYTERQMRRHEVTPGITGWAQVHGRNSLNFSKRFELDVWYVDHISFYLDLKILFLTAKKVVFSEVIADHADLEGVDDTDFEKRLHK